jgi:general stress protein YciG
MSDQRDQLDNQDSEREMGNRMNSDDQRNVSAEDRGVEKRSTRGFAAMSPEKQKQIASEGGRAAHRQGVAHEWSSDEARTAGRKGGQTVSQNREHMSEIGRRGGQSSGGRRGKNAPSDGGPQKDGQRSE